MPREGGIHGRLRQATAASHAAVEAGFADLDLSDAADYGHFLLVQGVAVPAIEHALEAAGIDRLLPDWPALRREDALRQDLTSLGLGIVSAPPFPMASAAEAIGAAYVLEGSRLGAAILARRVPPSLPTAFLRHGAGAPSWRRFLDQLAKVPEADAPAAETGAIRAFELFLTAQRGVDRNPPGAAAAGAKGPRLPPAADDDQHRLP